jgi:hypothetical protein
MIISSPTRLLPSYSDAMRISLATLLALAACSGASESAGKPDATSADARSNGAGDAASQEDARVMLDAAAGADVLVPADAAVGDAGAPDTGVAGAKRVFVTAALFNGNLTALAPGNGAEAANKLCLNAASAAGIGAGPWRAWVSIAGVSAIDQLLDLGPWYDTTGTLIFQNKNAVRGTPQAGIWHDEHGNFLPSDRVWTGTMLGGTEDTLNGHCNGWTTADMQVSAGIGQVGRQDAAWTAFSSTLCDQEAHLICFEQ